MGTPTELVPRLWRLGTGTVSWYLAEEGGRLTAIDAGLPGFGRSLERDLAALGRTLADVEAVVLTHGDLDHIGLVPRLHAAGARVLLHPAEERSLRRPGAKKGDASPERMLLNLWRPSTLRVVAGTILDSRPPERFDGPVETFADGDVLDVPGRPRVVHTPGHTPGHCSFLHPSSGVLITADAIFNVRGLRYSFKNSCTDVRLSRTSAQRLGELDFEVAGFTHGAHVSTGAQAAVRAFLAGRPS